MIPQITEIHFPEYATLSTATASLVDMGDKIITAQVKIDGAIAPDFSYDWEIEFQGERYIQPLRKPQGSKGNESICSVIDLTFYHKGIYDLKRYFFVSTVELDAGTLMADNYIVPLRLNIAEFVTYLNNVLKYYYGNTYKVFLNPDYEYDETDRKDIDINYTKIWDVVTKIYEWFGVRWSWETQADVTEYYAVKIGYPSDEVSHIFEYGFEGGLLKFERQVQSPEIANVVFGRGSADNIPYRYFKNKSEDNPTFPADPDWIPELENVYFANLRGKTFRDYVKGWKAKHYGGEVMANPTEEYTRGYNDAYFNPIEYVKDDESIAKYGEIQKGLEHNEEIKPTIQGVTIDGIGRVDQVVDVEPILVDESTENSALGTNVIAIDETIKEYVKQQVGDARNISVATPNVSVEGNARIVKDITVDYVQHIDCEEVEYYSNGATGESYSRVIRRWRERQLLTKANENISIINGYTHLAINDLVNIPSRTPFHILADAQLYGFVKRELLSSREDSRGGVYNIWLEPATSFDILAHIKTEVDYTPIHGLIFGNYENGVIRKSKSITIPKNGVGQVVFTTEPFTITEENAPATSVDMPFRVIASLDGAQYDARPNVVAINVDTGEQVASINLPAGTYYLQNSIQINNLASKSQTFKVELLPTYIYYSYESTSWKPTFDIWVKNIWQTQKKFTDVSVGDFKLYETDDQYASRVWDAILGSHLGDDAKVVFSSGWLSGHSDWEFTIAHRPVYDTSKIIDGVPSEWRITLYKSDAEMEATSKWLPSIATHANAGDYFYFTGIELPHQYVLWAEKRLDKYKREELDKVSDVDSTIVVQLDKVRLNQLQDGEARPLLNSLRVGNNIKVADSRFIASSREVLHLQSVTYTWDASTIMLPNIEVVLSDDVVTSSNPIKNMQYRIGETLKNVDAIRANSLAQISKAKKSIRDANASIKALSTGSLDVTNQVNALIGNDPWMSAREIAEDVLGEFGEASLEDYLKKNDAKETYATIESLNKKANKSTVDTLIGNDVNKSVRTIANEVLAGASTGSEIDLSLYLSKSEAETTYATKESLETANDSIDSIDTRLGKAETNIGNNSNLLSAHSQQITTLQTEQKSQETTIKQQGATILALDLEVDGIKGGVSEANKAIEAIETELENKADKSAVDLLSKDLVSTKAVVEIISPQVNANADAIKGKASQEEVNALSESVTTLEGSVEEISNRVDNKADKEDVQTLVSQINNVDTKANNALDKADKALADISELDASVKSSFDDLGATFDTLDSVITGINTTATNALTKATEVEDEVDKLAKDVESNTKTIAEHTEIVTMLNNRCDSIEGVAESAATKAEEAKELAETASQNANKANNTISGVSNVVLNLRTTVEGHTSKIADIEGDVAENKAKIADIEGDVAENKAKIEAIEEDYISKGDAVDFATDLTGVVEATAEEFVYRPSAGEKSIRDKSAVIRRIKGNSVVWEQKLLPLTSDNWNQYSATYANIAFADNAATLTLTAAYTGQNVYNIGLRYNPPTTQKYLSGHVYLIVGLCKLQSDGKLLIQMADQNFETNKISASPNKWVSFGAIGSLTNDSSKFYIKPPFSYTSLREGSSYSISNAMLFDLTAMFGAGNEPATVEDFRKVYNEAYYPYCQPELRGVKTGAIKTVGFNLFDGNCARVIGGMTYIVRNYAAAYYSESKGGTQTTALITEGTYTPECSGYLYLTPTKDSDATPCVHFQHSGVMDGECAPHEEHTLNLPEILKLFPNGMHAVGDVYDEINIDTYIQRCEYRDYVEGDESNAEVLTDGGHTVAKLTEPIITPLSEPITLDYYCEDWGSEEAMPASSVSAPFRADIVYQFNAEGRIRDNSRNIDKLEKIVAPLKNIPSNASLATQDFVYAHIPTRVATATERRVVTVDEEIQYLLPNILYDYGATSYDKIDLPPLVRGDAAFDNKWMVRFASLSSDNISIPFDVFWKDGIAPSWSAWCLCELTFFKDAEGLYTFGEWKIYK